MLERKRKIAIRLLITGSGVRVPHNPLLRPRSFYFLSNRLITLGSPLLKVLTGFMFVTIKRE